MGDFGTFMITVAVGVMILMAVFLFYYLGSIANSVYDARISLRKEVEKEIEGIRTFVQKELHQRTTWLRAEVDQNLEAALSAMEAQYEEKFAEIGKNVDRLTETVNALQVKVASAAARTKKAKLAESAPPMDESSPPESPPPNISIEPKDV